MAYRTRPAAMHCNLVRAWVSFNHYIPWCSVVVGGIGRHNGPRPRLKHSPAKHETSPAGDGGAMVLWAGCRAILKRDQTKPLDAVHYLPPSGRTDSPVDNIERLKYKFTPH